MIRTVVKTYSCDLHIEVRYCQPDARRHGSLKNSLLSFAFESLFCGAPLKTGQA